MDAPTAIDLAALAKRLQLDVSAVTATVELLDDGNTVPFITRYRKDQTGGLDEERIRQVQDELARTRALEERKQKVCKSIDAAQRLTEELAARIGNVQTWKELEEIYLPYKTKKQTLAMVARERGLTPLAQAVLGGETSGSLEELAAGYIKDEDGCRNVEEVVLGMGHLIAENFSEQLRTRRKLRSFLWNTALIRCSKLEEAPETVSVPEPAEQTQAEQTQAEQTQAEQTQAEQTQAEQTQAEQTQAEQTQAEQTDAALTNAPAPGDTAASAQIPESVAEGTRDTGTPDAGTVEHVTAEHPVGDGEPSGEAARPIESAETPSTQEATAGPIPVVAALRAKEDRKKSKRESKQRKRERLVQSFKDYFAYSEPIKKIQHHRVLAINRGDRCRILKVTLEYDQEAVRKLAEESLVRDEHPHAEFLRSRIPDALHRLILPSVEREIRRELTEHAELHAIRVFARNLRSLLLQPPLRNQRILGIDPGFRSGCKIVALDECGNVLEDGLVHLIGSDQRCQKGREKLIQLIQQHHLTGVAIGNGTACRETERLVADVFATELKDADVAYAIVNEAGASVYSTSQIGREELPAFDATLRGAVSIGRRLQDPLSELVKINPANIGVGLYQHDVKAKPLQTSLDAVVESCVNFVGVELNTASPSLLRYVSGMNQLTARRIVEYRREHGSFKNREQLKQVPGIGEATYVQAAGFLKIRDGDNPLDATWIHPESYEVASKLLERLDSSADELVTMLQGRARQDHAAGGQAQQKVSPESTTSPVEPPVSPEGSSGSLPAEVSTETSAPTPETPATVQDVNLAERFVNLDVEALASELSVGKMTLQDIVTSLSRPPRDPREDLPKPVFRREVVKLEDLKPGMQLAGTVLNVVDFGAFVDIGLSDCGLVHVSRLADKYVNDPHDIVSPGDVLQVWVVEVDKERRRVSLTAVEPGTEKARPAKSEQRTARRSKPVSKPGRRSQKDRGTRNVQRSGGKAFHKPRREKPKPVVPITNEMKEGKEPMRTFSDLMQFYKQEDGPNPPSKKGKQPESGEGS